jgi:hypothetical protein
MKKTNQKNKLTRLSDNFSNLRQKSSLAVAHMVRMFQSWSTETCGTVLYKIHLHGLVFRYRGAMDIICLARCPQTIPGISQQDLKTVFHSPNRRNGY